MKYSDLRDFSLGELLHEIKRRIQENELQIHKMSKCKTEQEIKDSLKEYFRAK